MSYVYRIAMPSDQKSVVQLLSDLIDELGPKEWAEQLKAHLPADIQKALASEQVRIFLAELHGEVVGLSRADVLSQDPIFRMRDDHRCGYVDQMYVRKEHRSRGLGAELLVRAEEWFRALGIGFAILHAAPRAVQFYANSGYQPNREMFKRL